MSVGRIRALLKEVERRRAKSSLAVYAGLHIPAEIEDDDLPGLHKLSLPARYIPAAHHRLILDKLQDVEAGKIKRLMILAPPGSAKSTLASVLFPAFYMGRHPTHSVVCASQTQDLADRFSRRARNLVGSHIHRAVFGSGLARDQRSSGHWETDLGGEYHATGVQPFAGRRADLFITDDLIRGRADADSKVVRESTWQWILGDLRPRLKPGAAWVNINTRWVEDDPSGRILPKEAFGKSGWFTAKDGEKWYVLCLAAVIETREEEENDPLGRKLGEIIWPEWFSPEMLAQEKRSQGSRNWNSLYQQKPRPDEGAILKKQHWRKWPGLKPPKCEYVISVYDTAFEEGEENDYTARTTWGIFWHEDPPPVVVEMQKKGQPYRRPPPSGRYCCILLEAFKAKVEFPELRRLAKKHYDEFRPDRVLVEKRASGHSLIQELRRAQVPVTALKADASKLARAHAASPVLEDGCVFVMCNSRGDILSWAQEVIDDCASATFMKGSPGNDTGDTCVYAWLHLRKNFRLEMKGENEEDDDIPQAPRPRPLG